MPIHTEIIVFIDFFEISRFSRKLKIGSQRFSVTHHCEAFSNHFPDKNVQRDVYFHAQIGNDMEVLQKLNEI